MPFEIPDAAAALLRSFEDPVGDAEPFPEPRSERRWPEPLEREAFHGLAGEIVRAIEPHTEADPAALLLQLLAGFGSIVGRTAHFRAEADLHYLNLFVVLVGVTGRGRKGTSWGIVDRLLGQVDPEWRKNRITSGLSTGEGLIWAVRDPIEKEQPIREKGKLAGYENIRTDAGIEDKRLLVHEPEFSRVLRVCERESNTLSAVVRQAWDSGNLNTLTRTSPAVATGAHISIIGHITQSELRKELSDTAGANGFGNRFLWCCVKRSKLLPDGGAWSAVDASWFVSQLAAACDFAGRVKEMKRDASAGDIWRAVYGDLTAGQLGMAGAMTSRADPQVMRLATLFAVLDQSIVIQPVHMTAALAIWNYCEQSVRFIFGDSLGDRSTDEIIGLLRKSPNGATRTEIRAYFKNHKSSEEIGRALGVLEAAGLARMDREKTPGRDAERWRVLR
jgi:hypothetical protein